MSHDKNIRSAFTLPSSFYRSEMNFMQLRESVFRGSWQFAGIMPSGDLTNVEPFTLMQEFLDEPLLLTRDKDSSVRCMSNVCTHRGNLLVTEAGNEKLLRCNYHGRCFGLDGKFRSMPGFEGVENFPTEEDDLTVMDQRAIGPMQFIRLASGRSWEDQFGEMLDAMSWFPTDDLTLRPEASRDYYVNAHWALYVDNYLEGFHVPFVHPGLNEALDVEEYGIELFESGALQIGVADDDTSEIIDIPDGNRFSGQRLWALYWWIYPNLMFNYYPWGISVNVVEPVSLNRTKVRFLTFAKQGLDDPDVSGIHQTELEDELVVEGVQKGMRSSFYDKGRYSPKHEKAVHHFHSMLAKVVHV